jgi:iron complex outermembrane recepter protein
MVIAVTKVARNALMFMASMIMSATPGTPVWAVATPTAEPLEEIVVTAQRREQRAQDVAISLSVLTGGELERSSLRGVTDALGLVPGVAANLNSQGGQTVLTIRGVTSGGPLFSGPSPIAYYLDSVPFGLVISAVEPDASTYDLNRIEVLRGPQGTLYGASALNGVVRVLTNDAKLDKFELKARADVSSTSGGSGNWGGDMALNVPLVGGRVAARLVLGSGHDSGWIDAPVGTNINDSRRSNVRLKIASKLTDSLSIKLSGSHQQFDIAAPSTGDGDYSATLQQQPIKTYLNTYGIEALYDAGAFAIANSISYLKYRNDGSVDIAPGIPLPPLTTLLNAHVFSQELTLSSQLQGPWRWSVGEFVRIGSDSTYQTLGSLIPGPVSVANTSKSYALFGEVGRRLFDGRWELAVGARYFHDRVGLEQKLPFGQPPGAPLIDVTSDFSATTPRVVLTWFPSQSYTMYASYSEGFRSGFPQSLLVQLVDSSFAPVRPDKLKNIEVGAKGEWWDGRLAFDAAVYHMKWKDIQQVLGIPVPGAGNAYIVANVNGTSVSGTGVDLAVTARPIQGLTMGVNFSWNGLKEDEDVYSGPSLLFPAGSRIDSSPAYTAGVSAEYRFALGSSGWSGRMSAQGRYTSRQTITSTSVNSSDPPIVSKGDALKTGRVAFAVESPAHWTLMAYCDNVSNSRGVALPSLTPFRSNSIRPRTAGIQVDYGFN